MSDLSKNYLYHEPDLRKGTEECRESEVEQKKKVQEKYDRSFGALSPVTASFNKEAFLCVVHSMKKR